MMARFTTISKVFPNGKTKGLIYKGTFGFNLCQPFMGTLHIGQVVFPYKQGKQNCSCLQF
jgi:hypothetical protein